MSTLVIRWLALIAVALFFSWPTLVEADSIASPHHISVKLVPEVQDPSRIEDDACGRDESRTWLARLLENTWRCGPRNPN